MQKRKSQRHVNAAKARWRNAEARAEAEREAGIEDRPMLIDARLPFEMDLRSAGFRSLRIEPRIGYVAWRAVDTTTGEVIDCAALKELLHRIADKLPRTQGARHTD